MLQQERPCQAHGKSLPRGCSSTGMGEQLQKDTKVKGKPGCTISFHTDSMQPTCKAVSAGTLPCAARAWQHLAHTRACRIEPLGDTGTAPTHLPWRHRPFQEQEGKQEPSPATAQHWVTAAAGLPGGCIQLHTPRHPALVLLTRTFAKGKAAGESY